MMPAEGASSQLLGESHTSVYPFIRFRSFTEKKIKEENKWHVIPDPFGKYPEG